MGLKWWQRAVFYQIYPRSLADGHGDGIGDFKGMIERLDYLKDLGIDAIWLSPHYPSPGFDCGYDVSNYMDVAPEYGTMAEFQRFLDGAHRRCIRVILDFVLNHTSHQHPWFIESRSSRTNPRRDWYIWRDGKDGDPPNNWLSPFGGKAWEYDTHTDQYYYHYFLKQQPDLNWRNPAVKEAMFDVVRFWLDRDVDGFRLDAIGTVFEDPSLADHTVGLSEADMYRELRDAGSEEDRERVWEQHAALFEHQVEQPEVHELMQELRAVVDEYAERVLVGETDLIAYYGTGQTELHLLFNFPLMRTDRLTPAWVRANQKERLSALPPGAWPCNTLGNHDTERVYSHFGDGRNDAAIARLSAALILTLRGTPFLYNGEEIGMTDLLLRDVRQFRDAIGLSLFEMETQTLGTAPEEAMLRAGQFARDKNRTPMQWSDAPNAGFSPAGVQTWLPVNPNYAQGVNVASQMGDPNSLLHFYRRLLRVRSQTPALIAGEYIPLREDAQDYLAFLRNSPSHGQTCLVVLNMSPRVHTVQLDLEAKAAATLFSSRARGRTVEEVKELSIAPFEVYIAERVSG